MKCPPRLARGQLFTAASPPVAGPHGPPGEGQLSPTLPGLSCFSPLVLVFRLLMAGHSRGTVFWDVRKYERCVSLCKTGLEIHLLPKSLTVSVPGSRMICAGASSSPSAPPGGLEPRLEEKRTDEQRTCQGPGADTHP